MLDPGEGRPSRMHTWIWFYCPFSGRLGDDRYLLLQLYIVSCTMVPPSPHTYAITTCMCYGEKVCHGIHYISLCCVHVCHTHVTYLHLLCYYSKTSDSGPSKIGTWYSEPLYKGHFSRSQIVGFPITFWTFEKRTNALQRAQTAEFILSPMCPLSDVLLYSTFSKIIN